MAVEPTIETSSVSNKLSDNDVKHSVPIMNFDVRYTLKFIVLDTQPTAYRWTGSQPQLGDDNAAMRQACRINSA